MWLSPLHGTRMASCPWRFTGASSRALFRVCVHLLGPASSRTVHYFVLDLKILVLLIPTSAGLQVGSPVTLRLPRPKGEHRGKESACPVHKHSSVCDCIVTAWFSCQLYLELLLYLEDHLLRNRLHNFSRPLFVLLPSTVVDHHREISLVSSIWLEYSL